MLVSPPYIGYWLAALPSLQELLDKAPQLPADCSWHFIGHLQSNKVPGERLASHRGSSCTYYTRDEVSSVLPCVQSVVLQTADQDLQDHQHLDPTPVFMRIDPALSSFRYPDPAVQAG